MKVFELPARLTNMQTLLPLEGAAYACVLVQMEVRVPLEMLEPATYAMSHVMQIGQLTTLHVRHADG